MDRDDLRRIDRVSVCCRVDVHDRFGVWTAITEDVCARGCRILTRRLPRLGSPLLLRLSSDLFPEELEVRARVVWGTADRIGVTFVPQRARKGKLTPAEWLELVLRHGRHAGPGVRAVGSPDVVPVIGQGRGRGGSRQDAGARVQSSRTAHETVVPLPVRSR